MGRRYVCVDNGVRTRGGARIMADGLDREALSKDELLVEKFYRDLDCEHRDVIDQSELNPCQLEAEFAITTARYGISRTRYCSIHVWNGLETYFEREGGE